MSALKIGDLVHNKNGLNGEVTGEHQGMVRVHWENDRSGWFDKEGDDRLTPVGTG